MRYILDTNIFINHLRGKKAIPLKVCKLAMAMSVITLGELLYGVEKSHKKKNSLTIVKALIKDLHIEIIPVNEDVIVQFVLLKAQLEEMGNSLEDFDLLIAATALAYGNTLVTANLKHFSRVEKLIVYRDI